MIANLSAHPSFPSVIDNTMRVDYVSCPRRFWFRFIHNLVPKGVSIHLHTGSVIAMGLDHVRRRYYGPDHIPLETCLIEAFPLMAKAWNKIESDHVKNFTSAYRAVCWYFLQAYPPDRDRITPWQGPQGPASEFSFVLPIDVKHPETGNPILVAGRFDMLGVLDGQKKVIEDEKTCMQLGPKWANKWKLRSQFTTYTWGAIKYGHEVDTTFVRGICFRANGNFDTVEAVVYRPQWMVDMWYEQLCREVKDMIHSWETNTWSWAQNDACHEYGGCSYLPLCTTHDPQAWVDTEYKVMKWDPTVRPRAEPGQGGIADGDGED